MLVIMPILIIMFNNMIVTILINMLFVRKEYRGFIA